MPQNEDEKVPPTLVPAITSIISIVLVCYSLRRRPTLEEVPFLVGQIAIVLGVLVNWINNQKDRTKVATAENLVPGITTPAGPVATETIIKNDPASPDPPLVISSNQKENP